MIHISVTQFFIVIKTFLKFFPSVQSLSLFHINVWSLNMNFDDLQYLLKCMNKVFDIIAVSENRIVKIISLISNINLNIYSFEFKVTGSTAGGTLLYIANHLFYKPRNDLNLYKTIQLASIFIEIKNSKKNNTIVSCLILTFYKSDQRKYISYFSWWFQY